MKTILLPVICCLISVCLNAQAGTLDSSFGVNGTVNEVKRLNIAEGEVIIPAPYRS